jgi:hypothetical protein
MSCDEQGRDILSYRKLLGTCQHQTPSPESYLNLFKLKGRNFVGIRALESNGGCGGTTNRIRAWEQ